MRNTINKWASGDVFLPTFAYGKNLAIYFFSDLVATALFDCGGF